MSRAHRVAICLVVATLIFATTGCGDGGIITFTFTKQSDEQVIEGMSLPGTDLLPFDPFTFDINLEQQLEKRDAKGAKEVRLRDLKLLITDTKMQGDDTDNFNFIDSIEIRVDSANQPEKKLAWNDDVPKGKQTLNFEIDESINLKPYINEGMKLKTEAQGSAPEDDTSVKGEVTIWVKAL